MPKINIELTLLVLHAAQAALAASGAYNSWVAITKLRQYEDVSVKAAEYSKTAAEQLRKTRTTEASGAGALLLSLGTSLWFMTHARPTWVHLALNLLNLAVAMGARVHMANFWRQKTRIPLVSGFNAAIDRSETVQHRLSLLEIAWLASALVTALGTRPGAV